MTATETAATRRSPVAGWRGLVLVVAALDALVFGYQASRGDLEALVVALATLAGAALLIVRGGRLAVLGLVLLGAIFTNNLIWMVPAANANATYRAGLVSMLIPGSITAFSLAGVIGAAIALRRRREPGAGQGVAGVTGWLCAIFVICGFALTAAFSTAPAQAAGGLAIESKNVAFQPTALAASSGKVTITVRNADLFWHTFTVDGLVDVAVSTGGTRVETFDAKPGSYHFYCKIPGHAQAGMKGTLTIR
jgi:plastocyanin